MKKKFITKKQVIEFLADLIVGNPKAPSKVRLKLEDKLDGIGHSSKSLEIFFDEGDGFFTDVRITVSEPNSYEVKEEDDESC